MKPNYVPMPPISRDTAMGGLELRANTFDEKQMTVEVVFTTGAKVRRYSWMDGPYDEELIVNEKSVRLGRLNAGAAPVLNAHQGYDMASVVGAVVPGSARIEKGKGLVTIQLSRREEVAGLVQDIKDGVARNVSTGYRYHKIEKIEGQEGDVPLWRVMDWEPLEVSIVPVGADAGAHMRSMERSFPCEVITPTRQEVAKFGGAAAAALRTRLLAKEFGV